MTMSWQLLEAEDDVAAAWRSCGSGCGHATFFHTKEWADAFCSVVAGVLVLYHGGHTVAWHAATLSEYLSSHASPLVYTTAIRAACADGFRWFDFNPSGHLRGVEFFKESFGAERRRFDMYHSATFTQSVDQAPTGDAESAAARAGR